MDQHHLGFVHSYRLPKYIRSTTFHEALESNPKLVIEDAVNSRPGFIRYFQTFKQVLKIRNQQKTSLWLVNFRGHEIYWPLRWLLGHNSRLIFDELVSPYDAWVNERAEFNKNSPFARFVYRVEKDILEDANFLVADSKSQAAYYADIFQIPVEKFTVIRLSVNEHIFYPDAEPKKFDYAEPFIVFTYGSFNPLQGMNLLPTVAEMLKDLPIRFIVAGGRGKRLTRFLQTLKERSITNISHTRWINFKELPSYMCGAGLCLGGPLGSSAQACRLITGKALQALACASPTVIGLNEETQDLFTDRVDCLLVKPGDVDSIARAIRWAYDHRDELPEIGRQGRKTYEKYYSMAILRQNLNSFVDSILEEKARS